MKQAIAFIFSSLLVGCTVESVTPTSPVTDSFDPSKATLLKQGDLIGINHIASGHVAIYDDHGTTIILLDPYSSQSGPDLKVYLSRDATAKDYIRVGKLKSTTGKQSYIVPGSPDIAEYHYVHIWCEQFTVVFGQAEVR